MNTNDSSQDPLLTEPPKTSLALNVPVLPTSYELPTTKEEVRRLFARPIARPPEEIRLKLWRDTEGQEEWKSRQDAAKKTYEAAVREHERECERIAAINSEIEEKYQACLHMYERKLAKYERDTRRHNKQHCPVAIVEMLTQKVRKTLLDERRTFERAWDRVWLASAAKLSASDGLPLQDPNLLFSRELRFRKLFKREAGAFYLKARRGSRAFITDIKNIESPLVYIENYYGNDPSGFILNRIFAIGELSDYKCQGFDSGIMPFNVIEILVRRGWEKALNITLNGDWSVTPETRRQLKSWNLIDYCHYLNNKHIVPPRPPSKKPRSELTLPQPEAPKYVVPAQPEPPAHCFDAQLAQEQRKILQGAILENYEGTLCEARRRLFAEGNVRPFYHFGGIPFAFYEGETRHYLCIGQSGSGKTTIIRNLLSAFLPLTQNQAEAIVARSSPTTPPKPRTVHEWSRSLTFQAVVYNAKSEYVPILEALGFNADGGERTDLIILDPNDCRCFSWDIAADIQSVPDAENLAAMLVPMKSGPEGEDKDAVWQLQARRLITAVIISLRRMTLANKGRQTWNLWDVIRACGTQKRLRSILYYHDTPEEIAAQLLDLSDAQKSSIYMSATAYISQFDTIAQQWSLAEKQGRSVSLNEWSKNGRSTVLVLPNTPDNASYGPLNRALVAAISNLFLSEENTFYLDSDGIKRVKARYIFMDEFGAAGHLPDVQRLFTQGRSFGVSIVAGLQEISSLEAVYGENVADTILGQFSYKACLKSGSPKTQEWMSKQFGERLEKLTKETHGEQTSHDVTKGQSEGTSSNKTDGTSRTYSKQHSEAEGRSEAKTKGSSQTSSADWKVKNTTTTQDGTQTSTNRQTTDGTQKSKGVTTQSSHGSTHTDSSSERSGTSSNSSTTWELRKDFNIYGSEFGDFKSPTTTGLIAGVYMAPSFTGWRADLPFTIFKSAYERQEALDLTPAIKPWPDKWEASRPKTWSSEDYDRLGMEIPNHIAAAPLTEQLALPSAEEKPPSEAAPPAKEDLEKSWPLEDFQFEEYD